MSLRDSLRRQCSDALESTFSFVNIASCRAAVNENDFQSPPKNDPQYPQFKGDQTRPTATAQLVIALADLGVRFTKPKRDDRTDNTSEAKFRTATGVQTASRSDELCYSRSYDDYLKHFLMAAANHGTYEAMLEALTPSEAMHGFDEASWNAFAESIDHEPTIDAAWARSCLTQSEHFQFGRQSGDAKPRPSEAICISHLLHAIHALLSKVPRKQWLRASRPLRAGCFWLTARLTLIIDLAERQLEGSFQPVSGDRCEVLELPSYFLQTCAAGLKASDELLGTLKLETGDQGPAEDPATLLTLRLAKRRMLLSHWADRQVHRMMARRDLPSDPEFDVSTLIFALRARDLAGIKDYPPAFYAKCLAESYAGQLNSGCWPDGFSVDMGGWNATSQPSVEIALALASLTFRRELLTTPTSEQLDSAQHSLKALLPFCDFMRNTRLTPPSSNQLKISGWCSDRRRSHRHVESWVTATACRVLHLTLLLVESCARAEVLNKYGGRILAGSRSVERIQGIPKEKITGVFDRLAKEVDHVTRPITQIREKFLEPLEQQESLDHYIVRTGKNNASFVLFGPPGSGKSFLLESIARSIGWPLLELGPGDFHKNGEPRFEETASALFKDLSNTFHIVVLLDECDELFRERPEGKINDRNMYSFLTASLLPKLQKLHDDGSVLFVVATNQLNHIDRAVRREGRFDAKLLLDRPDFKARLRVLSAEVSNDTEEERDGLNAVATRLGGLAFPDIDRVAKNGVEMTDDELTSRRADYLDWWLETGQRECEAAGFSSDLVKKLEEKLHLEVPGAKIVKLSKVRKPIMKKNGIKRKARSR